MTITSNVPAANVTPLGRGQRHVEAVPSFVGDRNEARLTRRDLYGIVWWQWSQSRKADGGRHRIASTKTGEVRDIVKNAEHDASLFWILEPSTTSTVCISRADIVDSLVGLFGTMATLAA